MKYFVLLTLVSLFLAMTLTPTYAQQAERLADPSTAPNPTKNISLKNINKAILAPFDQSDVVLVGKIMEAKELPKENKSEYSISVEKYLKNPKAHDLVVATGDGVAKEEITDFDEVDFYNSPIFREDDRVLVYLGSKNGKYVILPYSFALSKNIPTGPPPDNVWFTVYKSKFYGNESITISGKIKKAILYTSTVEYGANQTGIIEIYNPERAKYLSDTLDINPDGSFSYEFRIKGDLGIAGTYEYNVIDGFGSTGSTFEFLPSPLKQFKSGITIEEINCRENFILIIKLSDGSPACVLPETKIKLIDRGWAKPLDLDLKEIRKNP